MVARVEGRGRIDTIVLRDMGTGREEGVKADLLVTTGSWVPDADLARRAGVELDMATRGPLSSVDGQTAMLGFFAAGNLVHPAETADRCALGGRSAARRIDAHLRSAHASALIRVESRSPLTWIWPNLVEPGRPPDRLLVRTNQRLRGELVVAQQSGRTIGHARVRGGVPNRHASLPGRILAGMHGEDPIVLEPA